MARNTANSRTFTTQHGDVVELIGATTKMQIWINGKLFRKDVKGYRLAKWAAVDYSNRHAAV